MKDKRNLNQVSKLSLMAFATSLFSFSVTSVARADSSFQLGTTSKDSMYKHIEPHIACTNPIRTPTCSGICKSMILQYDEMRDINGRDRIPKAALVKPERIDVAGLQTRKISIGLTAPFEVKEVSKAPIGAVHAAYTENQVREIYPEITAPYMTVKGNEFTPNEPKDIQSTYEVGSVSPANCKTATVWVHGSTPLRGGLGMDDTTFGGAFNRMKRLAQDNQGLYYSPSVGHPDGLKALIRHIRQKSCPSGKIVLNCGSAGASACWRTANDPAVTKEIDGIVLIGGGTPGNFENSEVYKERIPLVVAVGERDGATGPLQLAGRIHSVDPSYPIRSMVFKNGGHMTPLRMIDWRETMNCMLSQTPERNLSRSGPATTSPSATSVAEPFTGAQ